MTALGVQLASPLPAPRCELILWLPLQAFPSHLAGETEGRSQIHRATAGLQKLPPQTRCQGKNVTTKGCFSQAPPPHLWISRVRAASLVVGDLCLPSRKILPVSRREGKTSPRSSTWGRYSQGADR